VNNLNSKKQNKNNEVSAIQSLKKLKEINETDKITNLTKGIQRAKKNLESLYKTVSEKRTDIINKKEAKQAIMDSVKPNNLEEKQESSKTFSNDKSPKNNQNKTSNFKKTDNRQKPTYNKPKLDKDKYVKKYTKPITSEPAKIDKKEKNKFANSQDKPKQNKSYKKKSRGFNKKQLIRRNIISNKAEENRLLARKPKKKQKEQVVAPPKVITHAVITTENLTVKKLAESTGKPVNEIVKKLFLLGIMATINSPIDYETAELVASEMGITLEKNVEKTYEEKLSEIELKEDDPENLEPRAPIVTVMGHVDHGKTSLLDAIRKTSVTTGEAGGITQHIGAYIARTDKGKVTFIDTPGHAAFTEMRARGAKVTDVAVLVVAADDGIMPQTVEAINHIKAAGVEMVVAINKIDKPAADVEKTKKQLADHDVLAEDWGGDVIMVPVSAETKEGIKDLLDNISLVAEIKEIKANPNKAGVGTVIEAHLDKGKGAVATIIVQTGNIKVGDTVIAGLSSGKIRAMVDDRGNELAKALPSEPVSVIGFDIVPEAGSIVNVVDEKIVKDLVDERKTKVKQEKQIANKAVNLDDLFDKVKAGGLKTLNVIVKAGVSGVAQALKQSLEKVENEEVKVNCVHAAAGAVNENDVLLAKTTNSFIVAFNVKPDVNAKKQADKLGVDVRFYSIIYNAIDDVKSAISSMKTPKFREVILGHAFVKVIYKISKVGTIAGCLVKDGKITRNANVRLLRDNIVIVDTSIDTLKIQKDDVKEAKSGFECGIKLSNFNDIKEGDILEAYTSEQIKE
jgi:translation initiation factor IF-2